MSTAPAPAPAPAAAPVDPPWARSAQDVANALGVDVQRGLDASEAASRLTRFGPNELADGARRSPLRMLLAQFGSTMIVVLLVACAITALLGEVVDAAVIGVILVVNAAIGFAQEFRAERAMAALRSLSAPTSRVIRDGNRQQVAERELVVGDVLLIEAGDLVSADARLTECAGLQVDEAPLTGESLPVDKSPERLEAEAGQMAGDRRNMVFRGTAVVRGRATAVVVATGMSTALGEIAGLLGSHEARSTPLQQRLARLGRRLALGALLVCVGVFAVGVLRGEDLSLMFLTAVSLAVAAIPEALPAVVTIALALGAQRMVKRGAIVARLPSVETLGSVTVICTDKTGTLTQGRMTVERVLTSQGEASLEGNGYEPSGTMRLEGRAVALDPASPLGRLVVASTLCNDASLVAPREPTQSWTVAGDPTEGALLAMAARAGLDRAAARAAAPRIDELPFDSERKRMTTVHAAPEGPSLVACKGALEAVEPLCNRVAAAGGDVDLQDSERQRIRERAEHYAGSGYRVLALADARRAEGPRSASHREADLTLLGLVAMADSLRAESKPAVQACRRAGISVVMITGDHPATARAIAERLELPRSESPIAGTELSRMTAEQLTARAPEVGVYCRVSPGQKLDIVRAWQRRGAVVAMTGDGVNDAPALRAADIGVAMGMAGTEVARQAADMVLTRDDFATVVAAVEEGRRVYDNIRRFVRYTLTSNAGEIWVMVLGPFVGLAVPLLPVQILWINLVTDGLPGLTLSIERAEPDAMARPPRDPKESIVSRGLWGQVAVIGLLMGLVPLALGVWGKASGRPWQTLIFLSLTFSQLGNALAVRSDRLTLWQLGLRSNPPLLGTILGTSAVQLAVLYWAPARRLLRIEAVSAFDLGVVLVASSVVFLVTEATKLASSKRRRP